MLKINRLAEAIQNCNCDIPKLAKQLGISQKRLENYASGKTLPPIEVFANICKILDLDVNKIILNY
ncbi:MAG: helix-turn-helix domain-containing protein [Clostridia bacterium]|nr:helix-turn-helix domain-containing protein [Clostridia bacterium]